MVESKHLQTAAKFIGHFATLDPQALETILSEDYIHQYAPGSLPQQQPFSKGGLINFVTSLKDIMEGYPMTVKEMVESESRNVVIVWAIGNAQFRDIFKHESATGEDFEYKGEYVFLFYMDGTGDKIQKTVEFVDSKATERFMELGMRAQASLS